MKRAKLIKLIDDYCENVPLCAFDLVENKTSRRSDLHAFNLLDTILPGTTDLIVGTDDYSIFLGIDIDEIAKVITPEQVLELVRCGVSFDSSKDCLYMFV